MYGILSFQTSGFDYLVTKLPVPEVRKIYVTLFRKMQAYYDYSFVSFT